MTIVPRNPWQRADPLAGILHGLRIHGVLYCHSELTEPWGFSLPRLEDCLMVHVVLEGRCVIGVDGEESVMLEAGDMALVPRGDGHWLTGGTRAHLPSFFDLPVDVIGDRYEHLAYGGGGAPTVLICAVLHVADPVAANVMGVLPRILQVKAREHTEGLWVAQTLELLAAEARVMQPGGEAVMTRLADVLVVQAIRNWITSTPAAAAGWLAAIQDPRIGPAIAAIQRSPGADWSVAALASVAALSRSAFAERFTALMGFSPMQYVTRWRMSVARAWLSDGNILVADVAAQLGYASETAFTRAYKRQYGVPPSGTRSKEAIMSDRLIRVTESGRSGPEAALPMT